MTTVVPVARIATVDLSGYHSGQIVQHTATMRAEGHMRPTGRDAFGKKRFVWTADRWQALHVVVDRSDNDRTEARSPWCALKDDAEAWLEARGLHIGGAYWHAAGRPSE